MKRLLPFLLAAVVAPAVSAEARADGTLGLSMGYDNRKITREECARKAVEAMAEKHKFPFAEVTEDGNARGWNDKTNVLVMSFPMPDPERVFVVVVAAGMEAAETERVRVAVISPDEARLTRRIDPEAHDHYLRGRSSWNTRTPEGVATALDFFNRGVGPAHQHSLRVKVDDRYVASTRELIAASLGPEKEEEARDALLVLRNSVPTRFIPGGEAQFVFRIAKTPENAAFWEQLEATQSRWEVDYCYCSVFDECWQVPGKWQEPVPAQVCRRDDPNEFTP